MDGKFFGVLVLLFTVLVGFQLATPVTAVNGTPATNPVSKVILHEWRLIDQGTLDSNYAGWKLRTNYKTYSDIFGNVKIDESIQRSPRYANQWTFWRSQTNTVSKSLLAKDNRLVIKKGGVTRSYGLTWTGNAAQYYWAHKTTCINPVR
jgi:hypothetical protein